MGHVLAFIAGAITFFLALAVIGLCLYAVPAIARLTAPRRKEDHLRTDRTGHVIINHPPGPRPRPQPPKGDAGLGDYNLHRHKAMLDADLAHYRALRDEGGH